MFRETSRLVNPPPRAKSVLNRRGRRPHPPRARSAGREPSEEPGEAVGPGGPPPPRARSAGSAPSEERGAHCIKDTACNRVRLAVVLDGPRDQPDLVRLELREADAEALRETVYGMSLLLLYPGHEVRRSKARSRCPAPGISRALHHRTFEARPWRRRRREATDPEGERRSRHSDQPPCSGERRGSGAWQEDSGATSVKICGDLRVASGDESCQSCYDRRLPA